MSAPDLSAVREIVLPLARQELLSRFTRVGGTLKADGSLVTEADLACQQAVAKALAARWPQIPLLGEEMDEADQRRVLEAAESGLWCLDPLDGTSNFAAGIPAFALSLAYIQAGVVQFGLVFDPVHEECFSARRGGGAWLNGEALPRPIPARPLAQSIALIDFKRLPAPLARELVGAPPFASQRNPGAVALEWCYLTLGRGHVYLHGRQRIWDYAAAALVLEEAGGRAQTLQGEPVFELSIRPRSAIAALDAELFAAWTAYLAELGAVV